MKHEERPARDVSRETPPTEETWSALERWLGLLLSDGQRQQLVAYREWLVSEAEPAGGVGPHELGRLYDRHVFDALGYLRGFEAEFLAPQGLPNPLGAPSIVDVGSGVGLPGIPLAIALPWSKVTLVDRSERRTLLARRAVRVLGLENVEVQTADANRLEGGFDVVAFRASLPIPQASKVFTTLAAPFGVGIVGLSRLEEEPAVASPPAGVAFSVSSERPEVLDSPIWLLRMRRT